MVFMVFLCFPPNFESLQIHLELEDECLLSLGFYGGKPPGGAESAASPKAVKARTSGGLLWVPGPPNNWFLVSITYQKPPVGGYWHP